MRSLKKIFAILMLAVLLAGMVPDFAYAAKNDPVQLNTPGILFVMQGASAYLDVEAKAAADVNYKLVLECADKSISITNGKSGTMSGDGKFTMSLSVNRHAEVGNYNLIVKAIDPNNPNVVLSSRNVGLTVSENKNSFSSLSGPAMEVSYALQENDSLIAGQLNVITFTLYNRGNKNYSNGKVSIGMEKGMTIQSGPASRNVGKFGIGETISVQYPVLIDSDLVTGSYPFTINFGGLTTNKNEDGSTAAVTADMSETVYIPLIGKDKEEEKKDESVPLLVVDSFDYGSTSVMKRDQEFTLKLTFLNTGTKDITKAVINVLDPSGAIVPTETSIIKFDTIKAGEKTNGSVVLRTVKDTDVTSTTLSVDMNYYYEPDHLQHQANYPISLSIEKKPEEEEEKKNGVANPILMVTNYDLGGNKAVLAGKDFPLSLTLTNTSAKTLCNIKVTVQDSTGSVLPAEGSNSFFIRSIAPGASYGKLMPMTVGNDVTAGNSTIAVNMSYEDLDAHTFTSSDTITVPVTQEDRLVIDDILDPGWLMAGEQGYLQIKYYNMGKTTLNNLRIAVSGDFTIDGDSSQYVGNMANGRSDYFSFNFFPNEEGECKGKAVFTYENAQGEEQVIEKEFTLNIQPAPQYEDPGDMPIEPVKGPMPLWQKILIGAGVAAAAVAAIVLGKKHKKAKAEALELDE
ncbi:MAG: hypothetical protein IKR10_07825 [Firmicutes bacterium]|nr:hypothetical protein [Bacillota bacterium]